MGVGVGTIYRVASEGSKKFGKGFFEPWGRQTDPAEVSLVPARLRLSENILLVRLTPAPLAQFRPPPLSPFEPVYRISRLTHVLLVANPPSPAHERRHVRCRSGMSAIRFLHAWDGLQPSVVRFQEMTSLSV